MYPWLAETISNMRFTSIKKINVDPAEDLTRGPGQNDLARNHCNREPCPRWADVSDIYLNLLFKGFAISKFRTRPFGLVHHNSNNNP